MESEAISLTYEQLGLAGLAVAGIVLIVITFLRNQREDSAADNHRADGFIEVIKSLTSELTGAINRGNLAWEKNAAAMDRVGSIVSDVVHRQEENNTLLTTIGGKSLDGHAETHKVLGRVEQTLRDTDLKVNENFQRVITELVRLKEQADGMSQSVVSLADNVLTMVRSTGRDVMEMTTKAESHEGKPQEPGESPATVAGDSAEVVSK